MATIRAVTPLLHAAPRHYLFTRATSLQPAVRCLSQTVRRPLDFTSGAAPPRLPKEEQEIFEALQKQSTGAFSTPRQAPKINQSPDSTSLEVSEAEAETTARAEKMASQGSEKGFKDEFNRVIKARGKGEELHPDVRRGAKPEFDGEKNPKTGEVGGPKNEPLRWGASSEWTYNGRATDF